jgi:soluble lytic murein transglycosylase
MRMKRRTRIAVLAVLLFPLAAMLVVGLEGRNASAGGESEKNAAIERVVSYLKGKKVGMEEEGLKAVVSTVYDQSQKHEIDYRLVLALIKVESNFRQDAVSKGAHGLFQMKPATAKRVARDAGVTWNGSQSLHETDSNIKLGVCHLSKLVEDFKSVPTALHAYNAGAGKVKVRAAGRGELKTAFAQRVLKEYKKNLSVLPDADELDD